ncbi:hypothetical protein Ae201684_002628 [Aphanomyces euteiches]|uniref:Uncharacterized protein n=1 Tax=Aphanomyces euteiches TaxID=100861 RepID=A0A6G0XQ30_9STRA|nr:hypothetical protein Ae201684_002628 [Aphanomyces euteiches]
MVDVDWSLEFHAIHFLGNDPRRGDQGEAPVCSGFPLAGSATALATIGSNPMEVVKTRMQLQRELLGNGELRLYKNFFHGFYTICKHEGIVGLQRGLVAGMSYNLVMNGVRLGGFESIQKICRPDDLLDRFKSGMLSLELCLTAVGSIAAVFGSPFFLVKARLQAHNVHFQYASMSAGFKEIIRTDGPGGLFRGVQAQIARLSVATAAQLSTYTWAKNFATSVTDMKDGVLVQTSASIMTGLVTTTSMHPFDVMATRLYNQPLDAHGRGLHYRGFGGCFRKTWATEGMRGLFKGWTAHYLRVWPHTLFTFLLWEYFQRLYSS